MIERGKNYLVNLGKRYNSEVGKVGLAVIVQNNMANRNMNKVVLKGVTLLSLTTMITRGDLEKESEICTLNVSHLSSGRLTILTEDEMAEVNSKLKWHLGLE